MVGQNEGQQAPVFVLMDQMGILRIEDGSLKELADLFVETVNCKKLPRETEVAISAGGHIARVGVASYA